MDTTRGDEALTLYPGDNGEQEFWETKETAVDGGGLLLFRPKQENYWVACYKGAWPGITADSAEKLAEKLEEEFEDLDNIEFSEDREWVNVEGQTEMRLVKA